MARPLVAAVQTSVDRLQRELRALDDLNVPGLGALKAELKSLHTTLFQLHALYGGGAPYPDGVPVEALAMLYTVADEVFDRGVRVRVKCTSPGAVFYSDPPSVRRLLRFLIETAGAILTDGWVPVTVTVETDSVYFELPWEACDFSLSTEREERAWIDAEAQRQHAVFSTDGAIARLRFARVARASDLETPESLVREVLDLRRERETFIHQVERTASELQVIQNESEDLRRSFNRLERTLTTATDDLGRAFDSIGALTGLLPQSEPLRDNLESAARLGCARVEELSAEVENLSASWAPVWARDGSVPEETPPEHEAWAQLRALKADPPPNLAELDLDDE